jgi:glycosyltransferase involved in cell wall biosynthesis
MAQGLPVVATDVGGMSEQVQDGITGRLVGREDGPGLAAALVQLAHDPPGRRTMGEAGRQRARTRFSTEMMVEGYIKACLGRDPSLVALPGAHP